MIKRTTMNKKKKISDEQLAAYIENMVSNNDISNFDGEMNVDTLEVLNVSHNALALFGKPAKIKMPSWDNIRDKNVFRHSCADLAMTGFLGKAPCDGDILVDDDDDGSESSD